MQPAPPKREVGKARHAVVSEKSEQLIGAIPPARDRSATARTQALLDSTNMPRLPPDSETPHPEKLINQSQPARNKKQKVGRKANRSHYEPHFQPGRLLKAAAGAE